MAETITPVVHGGSRGRWVGEVALHVAGATASAAVFGGLLGAAGGLLGAPWAGGGAILVASAATLYLLREALGLPVPIPQGRRQVPDWWRTFFSRPVFAFLYGAGLGVGFVTYLTHGTLVAVAAVSVASGDPLVGAAVMAPFGLARGVSVVVAGRVRTPGGGAALLDRLVGWSRSPLVRVVNASALAGLVVAAGTSLAHRGAGNWGRLAPAVLAVVFAWASAGKLLRPRVWRSDLDGHGLPARAAPWLVPTVPVVEAGVALALVAGYERVGALGALVLLAGFTLALKRARGRSGGRIRCGCLGASRSVSVRVALARNAVLATIAVVVAGWGSRAGPTLPHLPGARDAVAASLAGVGLAAAALTGWIARKLMRGTT